MNVSRPLITCGNGKRLTLMALGLSVALVLTLAGAFSSYASPVPPTAPLKVVMDDNYPPYIFKDQQGRLKGIIPDQWRLWERKTGIRVELSAFDWAEAQRRMEADEFDVIDTIFRNRKRERLYDFSKPYARIDVPIFIRSDISGIQDEKDLKGFAIAAKSGDNALEVLKANGVTNIMEFKSYEEIVLAARDGKVNVFTVDKPPALYFLFKMGIQDRFRVTKPLYTGEFHRAVRKGREALLAEVERGFALITAGEFEEIEQRWYGAPILSGRLLGYVRYGAALVAVVLGGMTLWLWGLRRMVAQRTWALREEILARSAQERLLRESERRFRTIFDASTEAIFIHEIPTGSIVDVNQTMCDMYGYTRDEVISRLQVEQLSSGVPPYTRDDAVRFIDRALTGEPQTFEWQAKDKAGRLFWVEVKMRLITIGADERLIATVRDISDRKQMEGELLQSQKMESVGRLAGGVAHDFNNMLSVIVGAAELSKGKVSPDDILWQYLDQISKAARRSSDITRQLLAFSRKEVISPKAVNLNALIIESEKILSRLISEDIELSFLPSGNLWTVMIDPSQFDQILMNLSVNARDAMPDGGSLRIELCNVRIGDEYSHYHPDAKAGDYVKLTVSDTGQGMDRVTREHIFEPFFTTKGVGQGTGLGLATVYGIVTQNNGFITVYSEPDFGTVFDIYLPRLLGEAAVREPTTATAAVSCGTITILLVEDEEMLLDMAARMLEEIGYRVIQANTPQQAIAISLNEERQIELVLTDVVMPGMNGKEMVEQIRGMRPEMKVLFMSGYTWDIVARRGIVEEGMHFIQKPLDMRTLNEKIMQVLSGG